MQVSRKPVKFKPVSIVQPPVGTNMDATSVIPTWQVRNYSGIRNPQKEEERGADLCSTHFTTAHGTLSLGDSRN